MRFFIHYCTNDNKDYCYEVFGNYYEIEKRTAELHSQLGVAVDLMIVTDTVRFIDGKKIKVIDTEEVFGNN